MATLFSQLYPFTWKSGGGVSVQFPVTAMRVELSQDLVEHRVWGQDGAHVESTGKAPVVFTAEIPFINSIVPGKNERWGVLYPTTYREFLVAMADRRTGELTHPELGLVNCKPKSCESSWRGEETAGCRVTASWVETLLPEEVGFIRLNTDSPATNAELAALDLDASIRDINPPLPSLPAYTPDFADTMRDVAAVVDQVGLLSQREAGKIDQVNYRLGAIESSITRTTRVVPQNVRQILDRDPTGPAKRVLSWPMLAATTTMRSALHDSRKKLLQGGRPVSLYSVPRAMTLAMVVLATGAKIGDLVKLNPGIMGKPIVSIGTSVRYFADAA